MEEELACQITGSIRTITEISAYLYVMQFSYLILRKVTDITANFKRLTSLTHMISIGIPVSYGIIVLFTVKYGISVMVTCGIKSTENYAGVIRCWPILMLPFCLYNYWNLYKKTPALVKSTVKYFLIQYSFFLFFFGIYVVYGLSLSLAALFMHFLSNDNLNDTYILVRHIFLILKVAQFASLIFVVSLTKKATLRL
jgi:hypothetical protein